MKQEPVTLYTRTTPEFDPADPTGTFVCAEDVVDTYGFSELGYDMVDYERPPLVWEVTSDIESFVSTPDLVRICNEAGIRIFDTYQDYDTAVTQGYVGPMPGDDDFLCMEEEALNTLLEREDVRGAVEAAGYYAARDYVAVTNMQPLLTVFWKPGTFTLEGPLPLVSEDPDRPQDISVAKPGLTP